MTDLPDPLDRDGCVLFWQGWPSNWHPAPFVLDGTTYLCVEQYMMAEKARLFGDDATLGKILAATSPSDHKRLGKEVENFSKPTWDAVSAEVVYRGNLAKYEQHPDLAALLLATGDKLLAEASPIDRLWGIGLSADHPDAATPSRWPGENRLGKVLMRVRETLRQRRDSDVRSRPLLQR